MHAGSNLICDVARDHSEFLSPNLPKPWPLSVFIATSTIVSARTAVSQAQNMARGMKRSFLDSSVCQACMRQAPLLRRRREVRSYSTTTSETSQRLQYAQLDRSIIRLAGPDAANFLHNLLPGNVLGLREPEYHPLYTAFLSAQGRILHDVMIYPPDVDKDGNEEWMIEVDRASAGDLYKHLKKHKLRSKFKLEHLGGDFAKVYHAWPPFENLTANVDPRPHGGIRWIELADSESDQGRWIQQLDAVQVDETEYKIHRMLNGIAEGQPEIVSGHALPQESNIDFFGGIDFFKGCYLGQELTIRTHHTGVVRKRILPCQLYASSESPLPQQQEAPEYLPKIRIHQPPPGSNISRASTKGRGRSSGKWLSGVGNIGLALGRLEMMTDIQLTAEITIQTSNSKSNGRKTGSSGK
jgi:folate-binding protein YgfZ